MASHVRGFGMRGKSVQTVGAVGQLLPAFFAQFNNGATPEAFSTAPAKLFWMVKTPTRNGTIEPNVSLDWKGDPIFPSMTVTDNDRTFDDDLDYLIYAKHPTDPARHGVAGGVPYAAFTKFSGGRRRFMLGWDCLGFPITDTCGKGSRDGKPADIRMAGYRGDFNLQVDADFVLRQGVSGASFTGDGVTTTFTYPFASRGNADLIIVVKDTQPTPAVVSIGWTSAPNAFSGLLGGTVTFASAVPAGYSISIIPAFAMRPSYWSGDMVSLGQHGNNRDPYGWYNTPSRPKLVADITSLAKDANNYITVTLASTTGTAQAGAAASITLAAGASAVTDAYKGRRISITSGTGSGQSNIVLAYDGTTKIATVDAWATAPDVTSTYAIGAGFADKKDALGVAFGDRGAQPQSPQGSASAFGDYFEVDGSTFGGQTNTLRDFNWRMNIITYDYSVSNTFSGAVTSTGPASAPVFTLSGTWNVGDTINLFLHGTKFALTIASGQTSLGNIATNLRALLIADGRFTGTTATSTTVTVVSTAGIQSVFTCQLQFGHNVPTGVQTATGGTAFWFAGDQNKPGTHADHSQYTQTRYYAYCGEDRCLGEGNYDGLVFANGVAADCVGQFTRYQYRFKYQATSDISSGSFRLGYTGGAGAFNKYLYEVYSEPRPLDSVATGIALSAIGGEGVTITADGVQAANVPSRPEVKGVVKIGPPGGGDFAAYATTGVNYAYPGESNVNPLGGVITAIGVTGISTANENFAGGGSIALLDAATTNFGGDIDYTIISSNVSTRNFWMHGRRLVRGKAMFDFAATPLVLGVPTAQVVVRGTIRGTAQTFDQTISLPITAGAFLNNTGTTWAPQFAGYGVGTAASNLWTTTLNTAGLTAPVGPTDRVAVAVVTACAASLTRTLTSIKIGGVTAVKVGEKIILNSSNTHATYVHIYQAVIGTGSDLSVAAQYSATMSTVAAAVYVLDGALCDAATGLAIAYDGDSSAIATVSGDPPTLTVAVPANGIAVGAIAFAAASAGNRSAVIADNIATKSGSPQTLTLDPTLGGTSAAPTCTWAASAVANRSCANMVATAASLYPAMAFAVFAPHR